MLYINKPLLRKYAKAIGLRFVWRVDGILTFQTYDRINGYWNIYTMEITVNLVRYALKQKTTLFIR